MTFGFVVVAAVAVAMEPQQPPADPALVAEAALISRLAYAAGACRNLGYEADRENGPRLVARFRDRARAAGVGEAAARAILERTSAAEDAVWKAALENPDDLPPEQVQARIRSGISFLIDRCAEVSREHPDLIVASGDEVTTIEQFEAMLAR